MNLRIYPTFICRLLVREFVGATFFFIDVFRALIVTPPSFYSLSAQTDLDFSCTPSFRFFATAPIPFPESSLFLNQVVLTEATHDLLLREWEACSRGSSFCCLPPIPFLPQFRVFSPFLIWISAHPCSGYMVVRSYASSAWSAFLDFFSLVCLFYEALGADPVPLTFLLTHSATVPSAFSSLELLLSFHGNFCSRSTPRYSSSFSSVLANPAPHFVLDPLFLCEAE